MNFWERLFAVAMPSPAILEYPGGSVDLAPVLVVVVILLAALCIAMRVRQKRRASRLESAGVGIAKSEATQPRAIKGEARPVWDTRGYFNEEWNFGLTIPDNWEIVFENESGAPWMQPLRIAGPKETGVRPFLSVLVAIVQEDGGGSLAYMDKAEADLRRGFAGFVLESKREESLLGYPIAWMTYRYNLDSGPRKEINATGFFGHGRMILFQFLCETDADRESADFPVFESIIRSLCVGSAGIRHPKLTIAGASMCELCGKQLVGETVHSMLNLKLGRLTSVCSSCRSPIHPSSSVSTSAGAFQLGPSTLSVEMGDQSASILEAASKGDLGRVKALLTHSPDLVSAKDEHGDTALHLAAFNGRKDVVEFLLSHKAEVDAKDQHSGTPLHAAAGAGHKEVTLMLLAQKAKVSARTNNGETPLHLAATEGHQSIAGVLLAANADVNARDNFGATPLHFAAAEGRREVAGVLLAGKADMNARENSGQTALLVAAGGGHKGVVELLLAYKAEVNLKSKNGMTPFRVAMAQRQNAVAELLRKHGGR